jgi:hypothetical protein
MDETKHTNGIFEGTHRGTRKRGQKDNIRVDLGEAGCEDDKRMKVVLTGVHVLHWYFAQGMSVA